MFHAFYKQPSAAHVNSMEGLAYMVLGAGAGGVVGVGVAAGHSVKHRSGIIPSLLKCGAGLWVGCVVGIIVVSMLFSASQKAHSAAGAPLLPSPAVQQPYQEHPILTTTTTAQQQQ